MAALSTLLIDSGGKAALLCEGMHLADELVPSHMCIIGHLCPNGKVKYLPESGPCRMTARVGFHRSRQCASPDTFGLLSSVSRTTLSAAAIAEGVYCRDALISISGMPAAVRHSRTSLSRSIRFGF